MVGGLDRFREAFRNFTENFVIIGGAACDEVLSQTNMRPRLTLDIDIIIIVENMTEAFALALDIRPNIKAYYNCVIPLNEDIDLIASTLWAKINPVESYMTEHYVSDFHRIRNGQYRLTADRFNEEHDVCRAFIERSIKNSNARHIIVVTHHVPSFALMADEFKNSSINGAFTAELGNFIADSNIDYWIYGHSHRNICKTIGQTQCVSNQLGYVFQNEHISFNPSASIEL